MNTTTFKIGDNIASPFHVISGIVTGIKDDFMGLQVVSIQYMQHIFGTANDKMEYTRSFLSQDFYKMGE